MRNKKGAINFTMCQDEKEELERTARDLGLPVSEFVRRAVRVALPVLTSAHYPGVDRENNEKAAG
jgi:hypothetical protein